VLSGKVGRGTLGAFEVRDIKTGVEFSLSGFDARTAAALWAKRNSPNGPIGRMVKYRHQPSGAKVGGKAALSEVRRIPRSWDMD
jgi:hypothetical protein